MGDVTGTHNPPQFTSPALALVRRAGTAPVPSGNGNTRGHVSLEDDCLQSWPLDTKAPLYFKLEEGRFRLEVRKKIFLPNSEGNEALAQAAQGKWG